MDIYERLKRDHDAQRDLCAKIEETSGDSEERRALWRKLRVELEAHAAAEEQTFYAELMEQPDGSDKARHSVAEHKELADYVEQLEEKEMSSSGWLATFKDLSERTIHHVDEEEEEVFPLAQDLIANPRAEELGARFEERKKAEEKELA